MSTYDSNDAADGVVWEPENHRYSGGHEIERVASFSPPQAYQQPQNSPLTWPTAVIPGAYQQQNAGLLTLNALLAPDLPQPPLPAWTQLPNRLHIWPAVGAAAWSGFGFWAHNEPNHAWFAAGFLTLGTVVAGLGALGTAAGNAVAQQTDAEPPDKTGTRGLLGAGLASISGAAATGAGFSGIGCMLTAGTLAVGYLGYFGWKRHNRNQAIQSLIAYAAASNPGPLPPGLPLPMQPLMPSITSPFEARILNGLEAMKVVGAWVGPPRRIADDVHSVPFELPAGANMSPEALAKKEAQLRTNIRARRVEVQPTHGARGTITVYDGPDRTDETYPWDGTMVASVEKPFPDGRDEAGRESRIDLTEHMLITGKTRRGKSAYQRVLLTTTLECPIVRFGVDCKDGAPGLGAFEPVLYHLATDSLDAVRMQYGIKAISSARSVRMRERGIDEWDLAEGPRIVVFIDELAELVLRVPQLAPPVVKSNLALVAASKITYVVATQTPSGPVFGTNTDARHQFGKHIGFPNDKEVSRMQFGAMAERDGYRVDSLDGVGKFLKKSLDYSRPYAHKALWVPRDVAVNSVERYADGIEDLDALSAEAFQAGMAAFDEALAAGLDPMEAFDPPPGGGGGKRDAITEANDFYHGRGHLSLVPTYPQVGGQPAEPIDDKHLALWRLLGEYGAGGALATELVLAELKNYTSESNTRKQLKVWEARGYVVAVAKEGRAERFARVDRLGGERREA